MSILNLSVQFHAASQLCWIHWWTTLSLTVSGSHRHCATGRGDCLAVRSRSSGPNREVLATKCASLVALQSRLVERQCWAVTQQLTWYFGARFCRYLSPWLRTCTAFSLERRASAAVVTVHDRKRRHQSGRFRVTPIASFRERLFDFRSCWIVFIHIERGRLGGGWVIEWTREPK